MREWTECGALVPLCTVMRRYPGDGQQRIMQSWEIPRCLQWIAVELA